MTINTAIEQLLEIVQAHEEPGKFLKLLHHYILGINFKCKLFVSWLLLIPMI